MAINSVGYDGTVTEAQWAEMIKKVGSSQYGVVAGPHLRVTAVAGVDRTVSIAAGKCWGHGVFDDLTANATIQLDTVSTGSRWDLIAVRRNWSGTAGVTTLVKVNGTISRTIPTGRSVGPGTLDDQPLALVQITAGQTQPTAIVDLRCWAGNGGMTARDDMVVNYLKEPGTSLTINGSIWNCTLDGNSNPVWTLSQMTGRLPLFGTGGFAKNQPKPPGGTQFLVQSGSTVLTTDANAFGKLVYPSPFPNGLFTILLSSGDDTFDDMNPCVAGTEWGISPAGKAYTAFNIYGASHGVRTKNWPNQQIRVNWIAIGW